MMSIVRRRLIRRAAGGVVGVIGALLILVGAMGFLFTPRIELLLALAIGFGFCVGGHLLLRRERAG
jgi:hypothetical protein